MTQKLAVAATFVVALMLARGAANADDQDQDFLNRIASLPGTNHAALIPIAHEYCAALQLPSVGIGFAAPRLVAMQPIRSEIADLGISPDGTVLPFAMEDVYCPGTDNLRQR